MPHMRFQSRKAADKALRNPVALGPEKGKTWPVIKPEEGINHPLSLGPDMGKGWPTA